MEKYLLTAKAIKTIGLKDDIKIYSSTTFEDLRYKKGSILYLKNNDEYSPYEIEKASFKGGNIFQIKLKNVDTIEDAEKIINKEFYSIKDESILFDNEFYYDDLLLSDVYDEENNHIGKVISIEEFPSQITLKVQKTLQKSAFFVPFNDFFIKNVDTNSKKIIIHLIEGLID